MKKFLSVLLLIMTLFISGNALAGSAMPDARVGESYSYMLWDRMALESECILTEGSVPGLHIYTDTGMGRYFMYSGTPTKAGTYMLSFTIDDGNGYTDSQNYQLTVLPSANTSSKLEITTHNLPNATVGQSYSARIKASGVAPIEFGIYYNPGGDNDFDLTGLSLSSSGKLSGTPSKVGSFTFTVYASDESGEVYCMYTLNVKKASASSETADMQDTSVKRGAKGEEVKRVQTRLTVLGFLNDTIDGIFGGKTEQAVKDYQAAVGLNQTGAVDELTYMKLFDAFYVVTKDIALTDAKIAALILSAESDEELMTAHQTALSEWKALSETLTEKLYQNMPEASDLRARFQAGAGLFQASCEQMNAAVCEALGLGNVDIMHRANQYRLYCLYLSALLANQ